MNSLQRVGGYASIVLGLQFAAILVIQFLILAPQGVAGPSTPVETLISVAAKSTTPFLILNLNTVLFSLTVILVTLGVRERMQASAPNQMRLALIAASVASTLFLANGVIEFIGFPPIVAANDAAAFRILNAVTGGLIYSAIFAVGWTGVLIGWTGVSTKGLPALLSYLILLAGVGEILAFLILILGLLIVFLNAIWAVWLGVVLLRPAPMGGTMGMGKS